MCGVCLLLGLLLLLLPLPLLLLLLLLLLVGCIERDPSLPAPLTSR